jgi:hypothetical protein
MDETDRASELEEKYRALALSKRKPVPEHDGRCLSCGDPAAGAYCDAECREDSERFERARIRNGF